jgi:alpha-galactosidase
MNRYVTEPGSAVGGGVYRAHVAAVYDIMDRLRKNHPNLEIQSCSSGGGRTDLGVFGRCEQAWVSDNTCAIDRTAIQEGCSLVYPAETMEAWVTNTHNAISGHTASVPMMFDVAMRGVLGIGTDLTTLDDATAETYRNYIRFYKSIRHVVQGGDLHRLRTLAAGPQQVSIIQYVLPDASEAVYSLVAVDYPAHLAFGPVALRNLDPAADYDVRDIQNHTVQTLSGFDLLTRGLPMPHDLKSNTSFTRHLVRR